MDNDYRAEARIIGQHLENGLTAIGKGIENGLTAIATAISMSKAS
jgi:hypothetical protein